MTMQPAVPQGRITQDERMLFTSGRRLGWTFRDRHRLVTPYCEPQPDPEVITSQVATRHARAERAWRRSLRWVARPCLPLAVVSYALGVLVRDASHHAHADGLTVLAVVLAATGVAWPAWCLVRLVLAREPDPATTYQAALDGWRQRAHEHEQAELARLADVPEWSSARSPARRTDIYGGTLGGWQALLAVHGASILAEQPLLVADFSGQLASGELARLARRHGMQTMVHPLPAALGASGILTGLTPPQFGSALVEAIHAGTSAAATRSDRAVDARVIEHITTALGAGLTPARLAAAVQAALGQLVPPGLLTAGEIELISGDLFRDAYRAQIGPSLVRLDAFLSGLARHAGTGPPRPARPAWFTCLALEPDARGARAELLTALTVQWLTVRVTQSTATAPAVIVAGADQVTRDHLEALAGACERRSVPLTLLFRHLRDDAATLIGGASATAFMRLGNHHEAEQAASFIGRHHKFVLSGWTATRGAEQSTTRTSGYSHGTSQAHGTTATRGWNDDGLFDRSASGGRTRSRDYGRSQQWSQSDAGSEGASWSSAQSAQRVYEYTVQPAVLQNLPANALLLPARGTAGPGVLVVECDPQIITLPGAAAGLASPGYPGNAQPLTSPGGRPEITPHGQQPAWPTWQDSNVGTLPAWPSKPRPRRRPPQRD